MKERECVLGNSIWDGSPPLHYLVGFESEAVVVDPHRDAKSVKTDVVS